MADQNQSDLPPSGDASLDAARAQAKTELNALHGEASADMSANAEAQSNAEIYAVDGVGRYAIPTQPGWQALVDVILDLTADVDYSVVHYPTFDAIIAERNEHGPLSNPLDERYDQQMFWHLRLNIAAVRNFLMQSYYANTPPGMSAEKAKQSLEEIADYLGTGLQNNLRFMGVVPNHNPNKPFIDVHRAAAPNGDGAQYLYECILEMQRQSSWMRPFSAVVAMFGGKEPPDWMLPSADTTDFKNGLFGIAGEPAPEADDLRLREIAQINAEAADLETLGDQLLDTAAQLQGVQQLSEPVRQDAIRIAKDILDKLKIKLGNANVLDGLGLRGDDEVAGFAGLAGVAKVYDRVLAWGRGIDPSIMNDPAVMAATQTIGQLGYLCKMEALRMAKSVGNTVLADRVSSRIAQLPNAFKVTEPTKIRDMLDRVERGIDTVLNRVKAVAGPNAMVGHNPGKDIGGSFMASTPTAGVAMQVSADGVGNRDSLGKRNAEILAAEETAMQAQAARINSQNARRGQDQQQTPNRNVRGQQAVQQARQQQQRTSTSGSPVNPAIVNQANLTAAQRQQLIQRQAFQAAHAHDHEHEHQHGQPQKINPALINPALMQQIKAATSTAGLSNNPVTTGKAAYEAKVKANTAGLKPPATPNTKPGMGTSLKAEAEKKRRDDEALAPPPPPNKGGGRGF